MNDRIQIRIHGPAGGETVVYLPGLHGDWTLAASFREALADKVRFVEVTYARTETGSVADFAAAIEKELCAAGIRSGWLIGESFGSQIAWAMIDRASRNSPPPEFEPLGLVLAGGFVRHPIMALVRLGVLFFGALPMRGFAALLFCYRRYARFRHRHAPETLTHIDEFVARRKEPGDLAAAVHRLRCIAGYDARYVARRTGLPVFYLAGAVDPVVLFPAVRIWLRRHCPGYKGGVTIFNADHNVLGTAPDASARAVLGWMESIARRKSSENAAVAAFNPSVFSATPK